jgi:hypothetical protein
MKKTIFTLCLSALALTAAAQDLPVTPNQPPPMRVPMPSLAPASLPATTPIPLSESASTPAPDSSPLPSAVIATPMSALNDNDSQSPVLPPPPPPSLPVAVIAQAIPCNVDMAYRKKNLDCAMSVLRGVLTSIDLGRLPEANLEEAQSSAGSYSFGRNFSIADQDLIDAARLLQSGNWSEAHLKLSDGYAEIKRLTEISDDAKNSVRSLMEFSEALEDLSNSDNAGASAAFIRSYQDAQDDGAEAAALFAQAQTEINALHQDRALHLLTHAYDEAGPNLKSSILLAKVGVLASLNGYNNPAIDAAAREAIENAQSGQQKAFATLLYAALVHNVDPARARKILDDAEALCNSNAEWARNQRRAIDQYRQSWGS